jgi:hypothetical protein
VERKQKRTMQEMSKKLTSSGASSSPSRMKLTRYVQLYFNLKKIQFNLKLAFFKIAELSKPRVRKVRAAGLPGGNLLFAYQHKSFLKLDLN